MEGEKEVLIESKEGEVILEKNDETSIFVQDIDTKFEDDRTETKAETPVAETPVVEIEVKVDVAVEAETEEQRLNASTSIIEAIDSTSLKDEHHPQLERPEIRANQRRKKTNQQKSFSQLEAEEQERQADALKPKEEVDQPFDDPLGIIHDADRPNRVSNLAQEAQNIHASFMLKAKERKAKEEADKKSKELAILDEARMSSGGRPKSSKIIKNVDDGTVTVEIVGEPQSKLKLPGCCTIS